MDEEEAERRSLVLRGSGWMKKRLRGGVEGEDTYFIYSSNRAWRIVVALTISAPSPSLSLANHNVVRLTNA